jgi:hypothetical protein
MAKTFATLLACYFRVRILHQNANAKAEFAYPRQNIKDACADSFGAQLGF